MTIVDIFRKRVASNPNKVALTYVVDGEYDDVELTYADLDSKAREVAHGLHGIVVKGNRILLVFDHVVDFVHAFWGCLYAGLIAVPVSPPKSKRGRERLQAVVRDSGASLVLTSRLSANRFQIQHDVDGVDWMYLEEIARNGSNSVLMPETLADDIAFLQYTSGSTGNPKGVVLRHKNIVSNQELIRKLINSTCDDVAVGWVPLYHDLGLIGFLLHPLYLGAHCVLLSPLHFFQKPQRWLRAISRFQATMSGGPNFAYDLLTEMAENRILDGLDLSSLRVCLSGAEPVKSSTLRQFSTTFQQYGFSYDSFLPCYGLAEATLLVCGVEVSASPSIVYVDRSALSEGRVVLLPFPRKDAMALVGCGGACSGVDLRIVDPVTHGKVDEKLVGEIWISGDGVTDGYWNRNLSEDSIWGNINGSNKTYLRTGDLGFFLSGQLFVVGRVKDLIIVHGRNFYPSDLESSLDGFDEAFVSNGCCVFQSYESGDVYVVQEIKRNFIPRLNVNELSSRVTQNVLSECGVIVACVLFVLPGGIPRTTSGKIRRLACCELFESNLLKVIPKQKNLNFREMRLDGQDRRVLLSSISSMTPTESKTKIVEITESLDERKECVERKIVSKIALMVGASESEVDSAESLIVLGFDSLLALELKQWIRAEFNLDYPVSRFLEDAGIPRLVDWVLSSRANNHEDLRSGFQIDRTGSSKRFPLSNAQQRLYILSHMEGGGVSCNTPVLCKFTGDVQPSILKEAIQALVDRHESLRTVFTTDEEGQFWQMLAPSRITEIEETDLSGEISPDDVATRIVKEDEAVEFDLSEGPLLRTRLFRVGERSWILSLCIHHIVIDNWSMKIMLRDIMCIYHSIKENGCSQIEPLRMQYRDFVQWQNSNLASGKYDESRDFWRDKLKGVKPLNLPLDRRRPKVKTFNGAVFQFKALEGQLGRSKEVLRFEGFTLYMALLGLIKILLHRYTGEKDIVVGTPFLGRESEELSDQIGCYVGVAALRDRVDSGEALGEFFSRIMRTTKEALDHQFYPWDPVKDNLDLERDPSRTSVFDVMVILNEKIVLEDVSPGLDVEVIVPEVSTSKFDLTYGFIEDQDSLACSIEYNTDLFEETTVRRWADHFCMLASSLLKTKIFKSPIGKISILPEGEMDLVLNQYIQKVDPRGFEKGVHVLFEEQAMRSPDAVAIVADGKNVSYRELNEQANRIANCLLQEYSVVPGSIMGLCMNNSLEFVVGILAVLKAGCAYLPIDPQSPKTRILNMLNDSGCGWVLCNGVVDFFQTAHLINMRDLDLSQHSEKDLSIDISGCEQAYVIYTSGSTGMPKGVVVEHRNVINHALGIIDLFELTVDDRTVLIGSVSFDLIVEQIFPTFISGASLLILNEDVEMSEDALIDACSESWVSILNLPTAYWNRIDWGNLELPSNLRLIVVGGEVARLDVLDAFYSSCGSRIDWLNTYGPTETTVTASYFWGVKNGELFSSDDRIPIGSPMPNLRFYVLSADGMLSPVGIAGELCISGEGLARGYLNSPDVTASSFIQNPLCENERLYRTGDLVRWRVDGELEFLGRIDDQFKLRGFRVELGEVESVLSAIEGIGSCVCSVFENDFGELELCGYWESADSDLDAERIRKELLKFLPDYSIPTYLIELDVLPRTITGKIDRNALPRPGRETLIKHCYVAPTCEVEKRICLIVEEVLALDKVGIDDSLYELGVHSLNAFSIISRIRKEFDLDVPLQRFFHNPTVRELRVIIDRERRMLDENTVLSGIDTELIQEGEI